MSRVIRGDKKVVPAEVMDARAEAETLVAEARAEAAALVAEARAEVSAIAEAARGEAKAQAHAEVAALLLAAQARREAWEAEQETALADLAIEATRHVVEAELSVAPERVVDIVRGVLARTRRARQIRLRVHPRDRELVEAMPEARAAEIASDESLTPGGCIVETDLGTLDARIEVRLAALARALGR